MDNQAIFMEYVQSDGWIAIISPSGWEFCCYSVVFVALYYSSTTKQEAAAGVARFGLVPRRY